MSTASIEQVSSENGLPKVLTGIQGLDEITDGGLPQGRPTLVCGGAGCGKTLLAWSSWSAAPLQYNEPGVFMAFEETAEELTKNVRSLGFDLDALGPTEEARLDYVRVERSEIEETGEYDLEGLFVRLDHAIDAIGAKRVVLDTIESLFAACPTTPSCGPNCGGCSAGSRTRASPPSSPASGAKEQLTRHGLEEYVSDCVILLDHRVNEQISTRRLRVVKYRGTTHGTNEYPFIIDEAGYLRASHHVAGPEPQGIARAGLHRRRASGRHAGRPRLLSRQQRPDFRHGRHGQEQPGRALRRCRLPPRRTSVCTSPSRNRPTRSSATWIHRPESSAARRKRSAAIRGVEADGPRAGDCTWSRRIKPSRTSTRSTWCLTR